MGDTASRQAAWALRVEDGIGHLALDAPGEKVNLLDAATLAELGAVLDRLERRTDVRCLLIESGKPGNFIAGADIRAMQSIADSTAGSEVSRAGQELMDRIGDLPFPTVAVIDGAAAGGGLELALACDFRVASDSPRTQLSLPEVTLGIVPAWGGTYRLPRVVGLGQALRMILTGRSVDGRRSERLGLVDACYPAAFLAEKALEFARAILTPKGRQRVLKRRRRGGLGAFAAERNPIGRAVLLRAARRDLAERVGARFRAPHEALRLLAKSVRSGRARALSREREALGRLLVSPECRSLVRLFFAREGAKRLAEGAAAAGALKVSRGAVLGAGVMGGKIAWLFSRAGIPVAMKDIAWDAVGRGYGAAREAWQELAKRGRADDRQVSLGMHRIRGIVDYDGLGRPDAVIEAVVEKLPVKQKVLAEVEQHVGDGALLASNTSSLSIADVGSALAHPERFVGMHFFNPPTIMPLVEVVPGARTDPRWVNAAVALASALGKTPVIVRDCPGFLVNRLLMSYLNEAARLLDDGADYVAVDRLLKDFGMPMGPLRLLDEIGLDIAREVGRALQRAYGARAEPAPAFGRLDAMPALLGRKSARGFYLYRGNRTEPNPEVLKLVMTGRSSKRVRVPEFDIVHRPIMAMVNEAARTLEEQVVGSAGELDFALILGTGFPAWRGGILRYADSLGTRQARELLARYADRFGASFVPARLIEELAASGRGFYQD